MLVCCMFRMSRAGSEALLTEITQLDCARQCNRTHRLGPRHLRSYQPGGREPLIPGAAAQTTGLGATIRGRSAAVSNSGIVGHRPVVAPIHAAMRSTVAVSIPK